MRLKWWKEGNSKIEGDFKEQENEFEEKEVYGENKVRKKHWRKS